MPTKTKENGDGWVLGEWASSEVVQQRKKSDQISVREDDLRKIPKIWMVRMVARPMEEIEDSF